MFSGGNLVSTIEKLASDLKDSIKQVEKLQFDLARKDSDDVLETVRQVDDVKVLTRKVENLDRSALRQLADQIKNRLESGVVVLGTASDDRVSIVAMVTKDLTDRIKASELISTNCPNG